MFWNRRRECCSCMALIAQVARLQLQALVMESQIAKLVSGAETQRHAMPPDFQTQQKIVGELLDTITASPDRVAGLPVVKVGIGLPLGCGCGFSKTHCKTGVQAVSYKSEKGWVTRFVRVDAARDVHLDKDGYMQEVVEP